MHIHYEPEVILQVTVTSRISDKLFVTLPNDTAATYFLRASLTVYYAAGEATSRNLSLLLDAIAKMNLLTLYMRYMSSCYTLLLFPSFSFKRL